MAAITAQMVKALREKTGAGMMDCKKALTEADGDMERAIEFLRKAGIAKAAKKAGRTTEEGAIHAYITDGAASMVEVLCETDFVARTDDFQQYIQAAARRIVEELSGDGDVSGAVQAAEQTRIGELVGKVGENIVIRRAVRWEGEGRFASYLHMGGKIGVLIHVEGDSDDPNLLNDICMHIAAFAPRYVSPEDVPAEVIEKEKEIAAAQVAGKPPQILEKIVAGKLKKWYTEVCLTQQPWLRDDKSCLAKVAPGVRVRRFLRWQVGEEVE